MKLQSITNTQLFIYSAITIAGGWTGYTVHRALRTLRAIEKIDRFERGKK